MCGTRSWETKHCNLSFWTIQTRQKHFCHVPNGGVKKNFDYAQLTSSKATFMHGGLAYASQHIPRVKHNPQSIWWSRGTNYQNTIYTRNCVPITNHFLIAGQVPTLKNRGKLETYKMGKITYICMLTLNYFNVWI